MPDKDILGAAKEAARRARSYAKSDHGVLGINDARVHNKFQENSDG